MTETNTSSKRLPGPPLFFGKLYGTFLDGIRAHPLFYQVGSFILFLAFAGIAARFFLGLGATTNMNDGYPWGIWIVYDVLVGTAIGTGGFLMAIIVYIFNKWEYHTLIRSAILTAGFGYTIAGASVIIDLGRYWNFYQLLNPSIMNPHSALLEVALCIMGYTLVVWIEFLPTIIEKKDQLRVTQWAPLKALLNHIVAHPKRWNRTLIVVISLGILLPIMHQSSLGSMMVIAKTKIHPLWHAPFLPILFILSVAFMGFSVVVLESFASSFFLNRPYECHLICKIIPLIATIGVLWIGLRFSALFFEDKFQYLFSSGIYSIFFWLEIFLVVAGVVIMVLKLGKRNPQTVFMGAFLLVFSGALYRFNVYLFAFKPGHGYSYFPSIIETLGTLGFISAEILLYLLFIRVLPVVHAMPHEKKAN